MGGDSAVRGLAVGLLGSVEIGRRGITAPLAQPRQRVLVGLLAVAARRLVTAEALIEGLWGEEPSPERQRNLHSQVSALRRRLAELEPERPVSRLLWAGAGYRLALEPDELDVEVFESLAAQGREAARAGQAARARELFGNALGLWRGAALSDAAPLCRRLAGEAVRLEEARVAVIEEQVDCDLALGRHAELAGELAGLAAAFPMRERLTSQLMVALYRCGRRSEALAAFDRTRRILAEEVGLDPGPALVSLQKLLLADDAMLAVPATAALSVTQTPMMMAAEPDPAVTEGRPRRGARDGGAAPPLLASLLVPRQLPAGAGFFAGREAELKQLDELLDRAGSDEGPYPGEADGRERGPVVISALAGMAGVGKTALAVHWACRVAGQFPDGQLYVNLRGFDADGAAVTAAEVTGWFLAALGIHADQIPAGAQARAALYRSVLAGRRVLIVLDNARDAEHVRPLLPGSASCLVVVTSRSALAGLLASNGARPLRLAPLSIEDSGRLLAARLGADRIAAEPAAAQKLSRLCGGLPLALAVAAARAAAAPGLPLHVLAGQLADAPDAGAGGPAEPPTWAGGGRLDLLETGDAATSLREVFAWSLRQLTPPATDMFALLGVHCGPDITIAAAASLAGIPSAQARRALAELADASLAAEHRPGRYVMHDLVRMYAAEQARTIIGEQRIHAARCRSLDHYLHSMVVSYNFCWAFTPEPPVAGVTPERLTDVLEWAQAEHQVLLQAISQASAAGFITRAWQIFVYQVEFLGSHGYWADCQAAARAVQSAAGASADYCALGWSHMIIGQYCMLIGRHDDSLEHHVQALDHFRRAGDLAGQAEAHSTYAYACYWKADGLAEAVTHAEQSVALFGELSDNRGLGIALAILGGLHVELGNYELARGYAHQALEALEAGNYEAPNIAWYVLGVVHARNGNHDQAISCLTQAMSEAQEYKSTRHRTWMATLLAELGDAHEAAGDASAAKAAWQQAIRIVEGMRLPADHGIRGKLRQAGTSA